LPDSILFYSDIVPINRDAHRDLRFPTDETRFGFSARTHIVPALFEEFIAGSAHLPILFLPGTGAPTPVFLVGMRIGRNALLDADGRWRGQYVPAYVRRYPLILGEVEGQDPLACIDAGFVAGEHADGERVFGEGGEDTPLLLERIGLMNEVFRAGKRSEELSSMLLDLSLFRAVTIDARFENGETTALHGMLTVDGEKLDTLSDGDFLRLRKEGALPFVYAHLASLGQVEAIRRMS
jgi:hypothetical protein